MLAAALVFASSWLAVALAKRRSPSEWSKWNDNKVDVVDKQWEEGDDEELLVDERKLLGDQYKRRKDSMQHVDPLAADKARMRLSTGVDKEENMLHEKALTGPTLMFADIASPESGSSRADPSDPAKWHPQALHELATTLREAMFSGGVEAQTYVAGDGRLLVALTKGWDGFVARDALLSVDEVLSVEWDGHSYERGWQEMQGAGIEEAARKQRLRAGEAGEGGRGGSGDGTGKGKGKASKGKKNRRRKNKKKRKAKSKQTHRSKGRGSDSRTKTELGGEAASHGAGGTEEL